MRCSSTLTSRVSMVLAALSGAIARAQAAGNEGLLELASFDAFPDGLLDEA